MIHVAIVIHVAGSNLQLHYIVLTVSKGLKNYILCCTVYIANISMANHEYCKALVEFGKNTENRKVYIVLVKASFHTIKRCLRHDKS